MFFRLGCQKIFSPHSVEKFYPQTVTTLWPRKASLIVLAGLTGAALCTLPAAASVDDFVFESFHGSYELDITDDGQSVLRTAETLVAIFPDYDQNRGIARYLPTRYLGYPLNTEVIGVSDAAGQPLAWSVNREGDALVIESVVPRGEFVRGRQSYVIEYRQQDVVRDFARSSGLQEFYWDINGLGWPQPFDRVTADIRLPAHLAPLTVSGVESCYAGPAGAETECLIVREQLPDGSLRFFAEGGPLTPYETMTVAIGFEPGTFLAPRADTIPVMSALALGGGLVAGGVAMVWAVVVRRGALADAPGRPVIVAEYLPPKDIPLSQAAIFRHQGARIPLAGLLSMAVSGKIRLTEEGGFGRRWSVIRTEADLGSDDDSLLAVLFGRVPAAGQSTALPKNSTLVAKRLDTFVAHQRKAMKAAHFYRTVSLGERLGPVFFGGLTGILTIAGVVFLGGSDATALAWGLGLANGALAVGAILLVAKSPLGAAGSELRDYLAGLKMYIRLAEKDRLHVLQSPTGALREKVSVEDPREVLRLYERLLPWAVVVGEEKRWMRELDRLYRDQQPTWLSGGHPRALGSLSSFSRATQSSFRSSSSGGTSGGGSAGGGGGGGGGGGR